MSSNAHQYPQKMLQPPTLPLSRAVLDLDARLTILPPITSPSENLRAYVVASSPRRPRAPGLL
jgi:hypothetical protein